MMFDLTNQERGFINEERENYRKMLLSRYPNRDADKDWLVNLKKVRRPREQFITEIK